MQCAEATALQGREGDGDDCTENRIRPERATWTLLPADDRHRRGRGRQEPDHDRAVAGRRGGEGERGQEREPDDDATGDHSQAAPLGPRGPALAGDVESDRRQCRGDNRSPGSDEQRGEAIDGDPGERDGEGEGGDSEQSPLQSGVTR